MGRERVTEVSSVELDHEEVVCVQEFCGPDAEDKLRFVRRLRHYNLVNMLDIFRNRKVPDKLTVTFEFLPVVVIDTCDQAYKHLDELRLAAIVGQVCVGVVSRFCANPTEEHMKAVDDIYAYLKHTPNLGLHFKRDCPDRELHAYVDADWAGCPDTRRSTTGYVIKLAGSPVSWSSRRQRTVAMSTCEAEYVAGYKATQEIIWIQNMINDLRIEALEVTSTPLLIDNNAALKLTRNPELHDRTKHIELKPFSARNDAQWEN